jgi:hypothetical protein
MTCRSDQFDPERDPVGTIVEQGRATDWTDLLLLASGEWDHVLIIPCPVSGLTPVEKDAGHW